MAQPDEGERQRVGRTDLQQHPAAAWRRTRAPCRSFVAAGGPQSGDHVHQQREEGDQRRHQHLRRQAVTEPLQEVAPAPRQLGMVWKATMWAEAEFEHAQLRDRPPSSTASTMASAQPSTTSCSVTITSAQNSGLGMPAAPAARQWPWAAAARTPACRPTARRLPQPHHQHGSAPPGRPAAAVFTESTLVVEMRAPAPAPRRSAAWPCRPGGAGVAGRPAPPRPGAGRGPRMTTRSGHGTPPGNGRVTNTTTVLAAWASPGPASAAASRSGTCASWRRARAERLVHQQHRGSRTSARRCRRAAHAAAQFRGYLFSKPPGPRWLHQRARAVDMGVASPRTRPAAGCSCQHRAPGGSSVGLLEHHRPRRATACRHRPASDAHLLSSPRPAMPRSSAAWSCRSPTVPPVPLELAARHVQVDAVQRG